MNRERFLLITGFALLFGVFFLAAANIWKRAGHEADPGKKTVRLAHWQLEPPVRAAFEKVARIYMDEHPDVSVEIIAVPERTYAQWFMTRLVGGFAPDLVQIRNGDAARISRYFMPLTEWVQEPNPYNAGGELAATAWRNTFIDGLENDNAYHPQLLDYYAVPISQFTNRIIYNRTLWREILGNTPLPANYAELKAVCEKFRENAAKAGRDAVPFLASSYHATAVYDGLFSSQTQTLTEKLAGTPLHSFSTNELGLGYLRGAWSEDTPEIAAGLGIMRDVSRLFQPGFEQISREDGGFRFLQGTALMIFTGSWDYGSFHEQAQFELGAFKLPLPAPQSADFGAHVLGTPSEGNVATNAVFGLTRQSKYPEQALDFLRFLLSQRGNRIFSEASGWLPAVVGVEPGPELKPFYPEIRGVRNGVNLATLGTGNAYRVINTGRHLLIGPGGSAEAYSAYLKDNLGKALREDLERSASQQIKVVQRQDSVIAAYERLAMQAGEGARTAARKLRENEEAQSSMEAQAAWIALNLAEPVR